MAHYIGINHGQQPLFSNVSHATSAPSADVFIGVGSGPQAIGNLSRETVCKMLDAMRDFIRSDDPHKGGANVLSGLIP